MTQLRWAALLLQLSKVSTNKAIIPARGDSLWQPNPFRAKSIAADREISD